MKRPSSQFVFPMSMILITLLSVLLAVFLPLLTTSESTRGPVKVYFADHISPAHLRVIEMFNDKHRGETEVVPVNLPFDKFTTNERKELLARSLRNKSDRLDVFSVDLIWGPRFAKWCEPLDMHFPPEQRSAILPLVLSSCLYDGSLVSMPFYVDIGMLYYRRDKVRRLPDAEEIEKKLRASITWGELEQLRARLGYQGRPYYVFQAKDYEGLVCNFFELIAQRDRRFFERPTLDVTAPAARAALDKMVRFVRGNFMSPLDVTDFDENLSYVYMLEHDAMFVRGWPNFLENFAKTYRDTAKLQNIGRAALPHFAGQRPASVFGGWNVMVSKYSGKKTQAIEFVRFLQSKEAQEEIFELGGYIPVNAMVYADSVFMNRHPDLLYYRSLLDNGFHRPSLVDYTRISDIISHFVRSAIRGEMNSYEALKKASEMIRSNKVLIE